MTFWSKAYALRRSGSSVREEDKSRSEYICDVRTLQGPCLFPRKLSSTVEAATSHSEVVRDRLGVACSHLF